MELRVNTMRVKNNRNFINSLFIACFFLILLVPILLINRGKNQVSEIDNRKLVEFPALKIGTGFRKGFESYLSDRIGFRVEMLDVYQRINADIFKKLVHPSYMFGEDGYVFFKGGYISDYQHLNINEAYIEKCASYIDSIYRYLEKRKIKFLYFFIPDKKTVYKEYFPKTIHVKGSQSQAQILLEKLERKGVPFVFPLEQFLEAKKNLQIYNKQYDAGHWNDHGALIGHSLILQRLREYFPEIDPVEKRNFTISTTTKTSLPVSHFRISEDVPVYKIKKSEMRQIADFENFIKKRRVLVYRNLQKPDKPKIMIFHDSYFLKLNEYYGSNFSEIIAIHSFDNLKNIEEFVNFFEPDVVLLENVERVISPQSMLFSLKNMQHTVLSDFSLLNLPVSEKTPKVRFVGKHNEIVVSRNESVCAIAGNALDPDGKAGKALFAKVGTSIFPMQYSNDVEKERGNFAISLRREILDNAEEISFSLISSDGKTKFKAVAFPIVKK
ncbi:acetyltransferase AlgX (SGNH hydrolase-like protein) [Aminivibrio pyruvatiphilus]|uniref:Acetyltransferase AlgX (SGNH hydrolase-like protein) n=1 Tax=Aminivibrio pyruvatiphilus TaxID=1005740 RepID=A0A4R8M6Y9_9BACT|nr:acetyltransferase AlgX (SGNH hydrolase-like protein) [Aminivibrio pyruvatiphilus]